MSDKNNFIEFMEDERIVGGIPFPGDLLFHFWNKDTIITDTYIYDVISTLKLYPKKSNNLVTTSVNTQFHVAKELVDYTLGFEISVDVYYNPASWDNAKYNVICGRGNNTGFPSGMFLPGVFGNIFFGKWKEGTLSQIEITGLTADWYRYRMIVTAITCQIKLLNLRTGVELSGNVATVGNSTVGEDKNFTFLCYGIDGTSGAYGSVGVNYSNIKISRGSTCILNVPLSEGAGDKATDICNGSQYQLGFFTSSSGWAKLSAYHHHNFRYGFTLYQKSGSANLYIPNDLNKNEIIPSSVPSGYTRIANYKECRQTFNQCENVFVLDDVAAGSTDLTVSGAGNNVLNGDYHVYDVYDGKNRYIDNTIGDYTHFFNWDAGAQKWNWGVRGGSVKWFSFEDVATPDLVENWTVFGTGIAPSGTITAQSPSDLYNADPDFILFTESTGVAKEITIQDIYSEIVDSTLDRGHLYINSGSDKNMMLYKTDKGVDTPEDLKIWKYVE